MKKKLNLTILKVNKKKITLFTNKQSRYIYTEADLGEGKLDEGFTAIAKIKRKLKIGVSVPVDTFMPRNRIDYMKVTNVAEDFSYVNYCC